MPIKLPAAWRRLADRLDAEGLSPDIIGRKTGKQAKPSRPDCGRAKGLGARTCKHCGKRFKSRTKLHVFCSRDACRRERRLDYMRNYMPRWRGKLEVYGKSEKLREHPRKFRAALSQSVRSRGEKRAKSGGEKHRAG